MDAGAYGCFGVWAVSWHWKFNDGLGGKIEGGKENSETSFFVDDNVIEVGGERLFLPAPAKVFISPVYLEGRVFDYPPFSYKEMDDYVGTNVRIAFSVGQWEYRKI